MVKLCLFIFQCLFITSSLARRGQNGGWNRPNFGNQGWNRPNFNNQGGNRPNFNNQGWNRPNFNNQGWDNDIGNQGWDNDDDWNQPDYGNGGNQNQNEEEWQPPQNVDSTPEQPSTSSASCGSTPIEPVGDIAGIIGGTTAKPYSWPWQIFLKVDAGGKYFSCGGSLISKDWVLTASHCLKTNPRASDVTVYAGLFKQQEWKSGQAQALKVAKYYRNPKYNIDVEEVDGEDVTLIKLKTPATFNDKVQTVCLPKDDSSMVVKGARMTVTGWGMTSIDERTDTSDPLKQLTVQNIGNANRNGENFCNTKDEICAKVHKFDEDSVTIRMKDNNPSHLLAKESILIDSNQNSMNLSKGLSHRSFCKFTK